MTGLRKTLVSLLLALATTLLSGCKGAAGGDTLHAGAAAGSPTPVSSAASLSLPPTEAENRKTGYLGKGDDDVVFVRLVKVDRQIKGQMQYFGFKKNGETDSSSISFDGVSDGEDVSLTFRDKYLTFLEGRTVMGTLKSDSMTLVFPQRNGALWTLELYSASVAEYNNVVRELQERARQAAIARAAADRIAAEKRAVTDAHNRLISIAEELQGALKELPGIDFYADALRDYSEAWGEMKEAHAEMLEESRKPLTGIQLGRVQVRLGTLSVRLGTIAVRRGSFDGRLSSANTKIRDAEEEIERLRAAFAQLQQAVGANTTGEPRLTITAEDISQATTLARSEINKAEAARDAAKSRAAAYDKQAADLHRQAEAFVKTLKPKDRD